MGCLPNAKAQDTWTEIGNSLHARNEGQNIYYEGELFVFPGIIEGLKITNTVEKYNFADNAWTALAPMPIMKNGGLTGVTHSAIVLVEDVIWVIGGRVGNRPRPVTDEVWLYDIPTDTWSPGPTLPGPAGGGGAGRIGNKIHLFGGFDALAECDVDVHLVYDLDAPELDWQDWTDRSPMPLARNHFSAVVLDGKLYAIGGQHGHDGCQEGQNLSYVHVYDGATDRWERLSDLPEEESHTESATFVHNNQIYMFGGQFRGREVSRYNPATNRWARLWDYRLPTNLIAGNARVIGQTAYMINGGAPSAGFPTSAVRTIDFPTTTVRRLSFNVDTVQLYAEVGGRDSTEVILSNLVGELSTPYSIRAEDLPDWLSVDNLNGIARESFTETALLGDATALTPGTYEAVVSAQATGYESAQLVVSMTVRDVGDPAPPPPPPPPPPAEYPDFEVTVEAECGSVGANWSVLPDVDASNGNYVSVNDGLFSDDQPPADLADNYLSFTFDVAEENYFFFHTRLYAPAADSDSYWVRIDGGEWLIWASGVRTGEQYRWRRIPFGPYFLESGERKIDIAYRENNARVDKVHISTFNTIPTGLGPVADDCTDDPPPQPPSFEDYPLGLEAECSAVGGNWTTEADPDAANGAYVTVRRGLNALTGPPAATAGNLAKFTFSVPRDTTIYISARVSASNGQDNSFYYRVDNGEWIEWTSGVNTGGVFKWRLLPSSPSQLTAGDHTVEFTYREDGARLDKIAVAVNPALPRGLGPEGDVECSDDPPLPTPGDYSMVFEAECATLGANWRMGANADAGNGQYVVVPNGSDLPGGASADLPANQVRFTVNAPAGALYYISARVLAPTGQDDSFYFRVNGGAWMKWASGLRTSVFTWRAAPGSAFPLVTGVNYVDVALREDGTMLDKLLVTTVGGILTDFGVPSDNCTETSPELSAETVPPGGYSTQAAGLTTKTDRDSDGPEVKTADRSSWSGTSHGSLATLPDGNNLTALLYPNPTSGETYVQLRGAVNGSIALELYDALGKRHYTGRGQAGSAIWLPTSGLPSGSYHLRVASSSGQVLVKTLIIR